MEIINMLTEQLEISEAQARGGAGLLFKLAKEQLGSGDYSQLSATIPGIENLAESSPGAGMLGSALNGLSAALGGGSSGSGNLAGLAAGFSKLGLDTGMIGKFIPVVLSFIETKSGNEAKKMLADVLV